MCQEKVLKHIMSSKKSINFMLFSFTDQQIADALILKSKQGVNVTGIMESKRTSMKYNQYEHLTNSNINVIKDKNPYNLHHKVFIIDEETIITGSYNTI